MQVDSLSLRRLALLGARFGPAWWLRLSPPLFGALFAAALPDQRRRVRDNLHALGCYDEADVYRTFMQYASCLAEAMALGAGRRATPRVEMVGEQHLRAALDAGRGAVLVTAHVGPWDAAGPLLARDHGVEVSVVMRREPNQQAGRFQDSLRARGGVRVIHVGDHPLDTLHLRSALGPGKVVAFQLDRWNGRSGLELELPSGPFRLASLTQAVLVPVFAARRGVFDYVVRVGEPIRLPRRVSAEELEVARARVRGELKAWIAQHPTQWFDFG